MRRILFVCMHNAGRSQMAAAFAQRLAQGKVAAESAGTAPSERVNPAVVEAMREKGIDLAGAKPKALAPAMADGADRVITMGCMDAGQCPSYLRGAVDWGLEDPSGKPIETVRRIRDEVERRVRALLEEMGAL